MSSGKGSGKAEPSATGTRGGSEVGRGGAGEQALGIAGSDGRARAMPQLEVGYPADLLSLRGAGPWEGRCLGRVPGLEAGSAPPEGEACFAGLLPAAELWFRVGVTTLGWAPPTSSPAAPQSGQALVTDVPSQLSSPRPRPPRPPGSGQSPLVPDDLSWLSHFPSEPGAHLPSSSWASCQPSPPSRGPASPQPVSLRDKVDQQPGNSLLSPPPPPFS